MKNEKAVIVCGTDFSQAAKEAGNFASILARRFAGKLLLVHVAQHSAAVLEPAEVTEAFLRETRSQLETVAATLRASGAEVESLLIHGDPHIELVATARAQQAELIVVGAVGHSRGLLPGSVAVRTAEMSPIPTLVVRQADRISKWAQGESTLRLVLGYDFSAAGDAALEWVGPLLTLTQCELTIVHINWPPEDRRRMGLRGPLSLNENDTKVQDFLEKKLIERARAFLGETNFAVRVLPGWGRIDSYLTTLASEGNTDLLILGSHHRQWLERFRLGSVSRAVLNTAPVSVLIVPPGNPAAGAELHVSEAARAHT